MLDSGLEVKNIAMSLRQRLFFCIPPSYTTSLGILSVATYLRGISFFVIGSYPTQATFAFSQLAQLGNF